MKYRPLGRTGMNVSVLSFGASSLGGEFHTVDDEECTRTVHAAIDSGINFIDVSPFYGRFLAEIRLGIGLQGIPRDRYFLATKCGRYGTEPHDFDFSAARVTRSVDESLERLRADYLDIIQVHDMEFGDLRQIVEETIPALQKVKQSGKARFVGITGLPLRMLKNVIEQSPEGMIDTVLSYCHYELNDTSLLGLVPFLDDHGIGVVNASPLGMGLLSLRGTPDWHPAPPAVKLQCRRAAEHCQARGSDIIKLAMQFATANPRIPTTLFSTANHENVAQNVAWISEPIDETLLAEVQTILQPIFNVTWQQGRPENNGTFD
jgi:L-galactose dehydrogenase